MGKSPQNVSPRKTRTGNYTIVECQFPVLLLFGHNLLVLSGPSGEFIAEMEGLATTKEGKLKAVGYRISHRLTVHEFRRPYMYRRDHHQKIIYHGHQEDTMKRWDAARYAKDVINQLDLPYPFLGLGKNSNSIASTLIACMGLQEPHIAGSRWTPWKGCRVLPQSTIHEIKARHGL